MSSATIPVSIPTNNTDSIGIHIFRRDLRTTDNIALSSLSKHCGKIVPVFFLDDQQIVLNNKNKHYFSKNAVQFMCECLNDLNKQVDGNLVLPFGSPKENLKKLLKSLKNVTYISFNKDYSKYAKERDQDFEDIAKEFGITVITSPDDLSLIPFNNLGLSKNKWYKQYGAFAKLARSKTPKSFTHHTIQKNNFISSRFTTTIKTINDLSTFYKHNTELAQKGGREEAIRILKNIKDMSQYNKTRDMLATPTSQISGHLNFGCVSIREMYNQLVEQLGSETQLIDQLYWRDFWLQILMFAPNGDQYKHIDSRFDTDIKWKNNKKSKDGNKDVWKAEWKALMECKTGYLLVDAGMKQMITTGYCHNRARMIIVIFWTKYLGINIFDPVYGSQVGFSKYLLDAVGGSQNKLNHQWATEMDYPGRKYACKDAPLSGRPMDISNKAIKRFDPECKYVKQWIPELKDVPPKDIYKWDEKVYKEYNTHVPPIFSDPKERYREWCDLCR
tara:strand:- start:3714 stop:5216 length:1503 start_codon:yes stop_codon:yes gene_type:complete